MKLDSLGFIIDLYDNMSLVTAEYDILTELNKGTPPKRNWELFIPLSNGVNVRRWNLEADCWDNTNQHDDGFGLCAVRPDLGKRIVWHGYTSFFHYDNKPFNFLPTLKQNIKEWVRCTRQPYQMGAYSLISTGICDPISYLHLLLVILIEPFKEGTSGKKLLFLFMLKAKGTGKPLAWLYDYLMTKKIGRYWLTYVYGRYYREVLPELYELAKQYDEVRK